MRLCPIRIALPGSFAIVLLLLSGCGSWSKSVEPDPDVASIKNDLRSNLPVGSSRSKVVAYLDKRGIEHSHIASIKESPTNSHTEMAIIRGSRDNLVRRDIQIIFKFDDADSTLVSYSVREIFTGP
jgi:hypothetical protein